MKLFDKFLKLLNVNRNTFFTFILTLLTIYLAVDRIVEMMLLIFTGIASNYWGPIVYTLALACPVFAFSFAASSSYGETRAGKVTLFYIFIIGLYIIALSMFVQNFNQLAWLLFISSPNYVEIIENYSELVRPAFCGLALYLPLVTIYPFIKFILLKVNDTATMYRSIWDFPGINLSSSKKKDAPYACDLALFKDFDDNKNISLPESRRYQSLLVCGGSGTGKTSMIFEPIIAQDIEKKYFFKEASKELGFTALKTGIANLSAPYSNDYLNKNFNLNMISPSTGKESLFNTFVKKMVVSSSPNIYKNIGITYVSPDYETLETMISVCNNYNVGYNLIDPSQPEKSIGLNPFVYDDPTKIAIIISSTLQGIVSDEAFEMKDLYKEEVALQLLENVAILLKLIYPRMNNGLLPNMEDLLTVLTKFDLVEKMCRILEADEDLANEHQIELSYFKRCFYKDGFNRAETEKDARAILTRLENLLRSPSIRYLLCNRHSNINFEEVLKNGEVTFVCTRRGDSGKTAHKAFGLFFLISMQNAILSRPGSEKSRIPHFLYIDEFPDFLSQDTETIFTMYRKYKVATTISAQSISQFQSRVEKGTSSTVLANCANKIYTGGATPKEELDWWSAEIGTWRQWDFSQSFDGKENKMSSTLSSVKLAYPQKMSWNRLQSLGQNRCGYKVLDAGGRIQNGEGIMHSLDSKYKEKHNGKSYNFENYTNSATTSSSSKKGSHTKDSHPKGREFEIDPIKNTETKYTFDDEEGKIIVDLKNNKKN